MRSVILFTIFFIHFFAATKAKSQDRSDTTNPKDLSEIVVTGQYRNQSLKNSVHQVKIITNERIQKIGAAKIQDVLSNELNIRFTEDVSTGGSNITMMGLKGQNVKILLDGVPIVGRQGINNEININQIDVNTIERIELVEGPMNVVYGADALAGVVNIITQKADKNKLNIGIRLHEETIGNEYGFFSKGLHNPSANITYRLKKWEFGASGALNHFSGWKDTALGRELVWNLKDQRLGSAFIGYKNAHFNIRYRIDGLDEMIEDPGNFLYPQLATSDTLAINKQYFSNRVMQQLQANCFINSKWSLHAQSSFTDYNRQVYSTTLSKNTGDVRLDLTPESQSLVNFKGFNFQANAIFTVNDQLAFQPGVDINTESGEGERLKAGLNKVGDYAFFVTSEYKGIKKLNIRPGIRVIKNSVYDAPPVVPALNIKYAITPKLDFRAGYARGFRAPSLRELYFNFFDINHQILGNPNLKAEISHTFNTSVNYQGQNINKLNYLISATAFYNNVDNLIDYAVMPGNSDIFTIENIYNSKNAGFSLSSTLGKQNWTVNGGLGYCGFYNDFSPLDTKLPVMQWSPEANFRGTYNFGKSGFDANLQYKFIGSRPGYIQNGNDLVAIKTQGYHLADFTLNKKFDKYVSIQAGVKNIFGVKRIKASSQQVSVHTNNNTTSIATGRGYFLGLNFQLSK